MKHRSLLLFLLAGGLFLGLQPVEANLWLGGSGNWTDDNWGLSGGYPGDGANSSASIDSGVVTVDGSGIANSISTLSMGGNGTLNIQGDLFTSANTEWRFIRNTTINQTAGTVSQNGFGSFIMLYNTSQSIDTTRWNLSGGEITAAQRAFVIGRIGQNSPGTGVLDISGTGSIDTSRDIWLTAQNSTLSIDASQGVSVLTGSGYGLRLDSANTSEASFDYRSRVEVTGYHAMTTLAPGNMNIYQGEFAESSTDPGSASAVAAFTLDANGVNAWSIGTLNLGDGVTNPKGDLEADVSAKPGAFAVSLFNYDSLVNGSFGDVSVMLNGNAMTLGTDPSGDPSNLAEGEYYLSYGSGTSDSVVLYYNIPEPSSMLLFAAGMLGLFARSRRRS